MAHIIVVGNEKGGAGKSTVSMHVATALARMGKRVAVLDLDLRQKTFARYVTNRKAFLEQSGLDLPSPSYFDLPEIDLSRRLALFLKNLRSAPICLGFKCYVPAACNGFIDSMIFQR